MSSMEASSVRGSESGRVIGRIVELWRYPVKSMAAQSLTEAEVSWRGIAGDRRWAFVRPGMERSGFPWLTARELPDLFKYVPSFSAPKRPDSSPVMVKTPSGRELEVVDPELAAELGEGVRVIKQDRGVFDSAPLSLISTQTVAALGQLAGAELETLRFRPNLVIEANTEANIEANTEASSDYPEDAWVSASLQIGGMVMRIDERDSRCVMVNTHPTTTEKNPAVLRAIAGHRQARLGVYGSVVREGKVTVGDAVMLLQGR